MKNQVYLSFDFGTKRIGMAVGQSITKTATPLATLKADNGVPNWEIITKTMAEWHPSALIVGIPLNMDGTEQPITQQARHFANQLKKRYQLPVYGVDERLTTRDAKERVFSKGGYKALQKSQIDSIAAQLILEDWLAQ